MSAGAHPLVFGCSAGLGKCRAAEAVHELVNDE